ncbi:hypothetical protein UFOVP59_43 [uncultured Caudovirales phage]|uniref:Uncharacterized protein n=1 Tax=uncultured Caudovirales phage TaxID=2100421 RepID=A0A6J5KUE2_9CAUD|nr:hypothetical protein UFOVP59_43 [uncultured Caudovirales phage]CAB5221027.1 hypothetical protein UFOVP246_72 [uncultured Caudovirales phage]
MIDEITYYIPVEAYHKQLDQMIKKMYRELTPMDAEFYQHEVEKVFDYNHKTGSAYYPIKQTELWTPQAAQEGDLK